MSTAIRIPGTGSWLSVTGSGTAADPWVPQISVGAQVGAIPLPGTGGYIATSNAANANGHFPESDPAILAVDVADLPVPPNWLVNWPSQIRTANYVLTPADRGIIQQNYSCSDITITLPIYTSVSDGDIYCVGAINGGELILLAPDQTSGNDIIYDGETVTAVTFALERDLVSSTTGFKAVSTEAGFLMVRADSIVAGASPYVVWEVILNNGFTAQ